MKLRPAAAALSGGSSCFLFPRRQKRCVHKTKHHTDSAARFYGHSVLWCFITFPAILVYLHNCILSFLIQTYKIRCSYSFGQRCLRRPQSQIHKNLQARSLNIRRPCAGIFPPGKAAKPAEPLFHETAGLPAYSKTKSVFFRFIIFDGFFELLAGLYRTYLSWYPAASSI